MDWTVTVGSVLSTLAIVGAVAGGAYRLLTNHLQHFEERLNLRFDAIDKDIRELRDWTIVMRDTKRTKAN